MNIQAALFYKENQTSEWSLQKICLQGIIVRDSRPDKQWPQTQTK